MENKKGLMILYHSPKLLASWFQRRTFKVFYYKYSERKCTPWSGYFRFIPGHVWQGLQYALQHTKYISAEGLDHGIREDFKSVSNDMSMGGKDH